MEKNHPMLVDEKSIEGAIVRTLSGLQTAEGKNDGHYVHFYEDDEFVIEAIGSFIGRGIRDGESVLVLATADHREELRKKLMAEGIDLAGLEERGLFTSLDAHDILSRVMDGGSLDENLFLEIVGNLVGEGMKSSHGLRVFGELVALLVEAGKEETAIRVEQLWNRIGREYFISIFCAYPIKGIQSAAQKDAFLRICNEHAEAIPGEGLHGKQGEGWRRTIADLEQQSFSLEAELASRRQAQMELQSTRDQLAGFLDSASIGLTWVGPDGIIQWANKAQYEALKFGREEYVGLPFRDFFAEHEVIDDILARIPQGGKILNREAHLRCKDGSLRTVLLDGSEFRRHDRFHHARFFIRDITEPKRTGDIHPRSPAFPESADDAFIQEDMDGTIRSWNKGATAVFGYREEEILGKPITQLVPADREDEDYFLRERIRKGEEIHGYETVRIRKDRTLFEVSQTVSPIRNPEGGIIGAAKLVRDVTKQKKRAQSLRNSSEQLNHYRKMESLGSLVGGVAHDFNDILTIINGYSDLAILSANTDGSLRECLNEIKKAGLRAASLTQQLLSYSRKRIMAPTVLLLNRVVEEMERMLRMTLGKDIELSLDLDPDLALIEADTDQIHTIILNLAINARDAMPDGGRLTLKTANAFRDGNRTAGVPEEQAGPKVMLGVQDTGTGMNEEVKARIFEPFFTTKETGKGTGLGLASVYGLAKQNAATIEVDSEPGIGTEFRILFPVETAAGGVR